MVRRKVPRSLWDYGMVWCSEIISLTHSTAGLTTSDIPREYSTGKTGDISEYLDFDLYETVWYKAIAGFGPELPGRWLGVAHNTRRLMCYHILA